MSGQQEYGTVYHIDFELIKKAREMDIQSQIIKIETQIDDAEQDLQLVKVAERALDEVQSVLERMRDIAVEVTSNPKADREKLNKRFQTYKVQIDGIIKSATFSGVNLLDGSMGSINSIIAAVRSTLK